jgi:hypothetical protein
MILEANSVEELISISWIVLPGHRMEESEI